TRPENIRKACARVPGGVALRATTPATPGRSERGRVAGVEPAQPASPQQAPVLGPERSDLSGARLSTPEPRGYLLRPDGHLRFEGSRGPAPSPAEGGSLVPPTRVGLPGRFVGGDLELVALPVRSRAMTGLATERLILRMFGESDLDAYAAMCGD